MTTRPESEMPRRCVFVVTEDPLYGELLRFGLNANRFDCHVVKNGVTTVRTLAAAKPVAVILDIFMAHLDGTTLLRQLGEGDASIPVLALLNSDARITTIELLVAGAHDVLTKPVDFPTILESLERNLAEPRRSSELGPLPESTER